MVHVLKHRDMSSPSLESLRRPRCREGRAEYGGRQTSLLESWCLKNGKEGLACVIVPNDYCCCSLPCWPSLLLLQPVSSSLCLSPSAVPSSQGAPAEHQHHRPVLHVVNPRPSAQRRVLGSLCLSGFNYNDCCSLVLLDSHYYRFTPLNFSRLLLRLS